MNSPGEIPSMGGFPSDSVEKEPVPSSSEAVSLPAGMAEAPLAPSPADLAWTVLGQSAPKPSNDRYEKADGTVWRQSEDRFRFSENSDGVLAAVADGAGSSGMFCGAWAETLVERLPEQPISGLEALNQWIEEFWEDFSTEHKRRAQQDAGKLTKFVQEGSYSTLAACWLEKRDDGMSLNWLGYGDSPILVFDRGGKEVALPACYPPTLAAMTHDPHLLNWKDMPKEAHLHVGSVDLTTPSTIILASDGIGQYVLMRYLTVLHAGRGGDETRESSAGLGLLGEFRQLLHSGNGKLADLAKAHSEVHGPGFAGELAGLRRNLGSAEDFLAMTRDHHDKGLMPNDDATLILIDIDYRITDEMEGEQ